MHAINTQSRHLPESDLEGIEEFKIQTPGIIRNLLAELIQKRVTVSIYPPSLDDAYTVCRVVELDGDYVDLEMHCEDGDHWGRRCNERCIVVGFLDGVKVQFHPEIQAVAQEDKAAILRCSFPDFAYRIQRRGAFRVFAKRGDAPQLVIRGEPGCEVSYPILDLSATGLAFELPIQAPRVAPGDILEHARLELGPRVPIPCTLLVRSLGDIGATQDQAESIRVGAEFVNLPSAVERNIQTYVHEAERAAMRMSE